MIPALPDRPSVLLRSEPAAVRFKAAVAPRDGRTPPSFTEQARVLFRGQFDLFARKPAPLVQAGPDPETPFFRRFGMTAPKGKPAWAGARSDDLERKRSWPGPHPPLAIPPASCNCARAPPSKWSG
ncbi:hypothetical protein IE4872_PB00143 (plasmid) [Rhizobium gallicum]|uniref:Uncharacterized protein n=1 Tax=Rhizobium gallicum TaxID=56730 RepID=A0A1L5NQ41_9HYPH|nr:hypothetical protein IE4872_PB00143 [Rhizobium gallicum]